MSETNPLPVSTLCKLNIAFSKRFCLNDPSGKLFEQVKHPKDALMSALAKSGPSLSSTRLDKATGS